jgi:hypothetical protein
MKILRVNRVEMLLPGRDIPDAVRVFNEVLGAHLPPPKEVPGLQFSTSTDYAAGIQVIGPIDESSPMHASFDRKPTRGSIGPLLFEVDDFESAKLAVADKGYRVAYEYGEPGVRQLHLDDQQLFGFSIAFTERRSAEATPTPTRVRALQRVELVVAPEDIESAREVFADLLGVEFSPLRKIEDPGIVTTFDHRVGIELLAAAESGTAAHASLTAKGRGGIGPVLWSVDDLDGAKTEVQDLGYRVSFEYGAPGARQVHLDPHQLFGYSITFTERPPAT